MLLRQDLTDLNERFFMHLICEKVRENITPAQWAQYAPGQPYQRTCSQCNHCANSQLAATMSL